MRSVIRAVTLALLAALASGADGRAEVGVLDIYDCKQNCVPVPEDIIVSLQRCFRGKSDEQRLAQCAEPGFDAIDPILPIIASNFYARVPEANREPCKPANGSTQSMIASVDCMIASFDPPNPSAQIAGERFVRGLENQAAFANACRRLGGTCSPRAWPNVAVPYNPNLPAIEGYASKGILGHSPLARGRGTHNLPDLFGPNGCHPDSFTCEGTEDAARLEPAYGIANSCLNGFLCDEAWASTRVAPNRTEVALIRATWEPYFEQLRDRYAQLRTEMLRRLMVQASALAAAEATDCEGTLNLTIEKWRKKLYGCVGVQGEKILQAAMSSPEARKRNLEVCRANNGGDEATREHYRKGLHEDAHNLLVRRCAKYFVDGFPHDNASDDYQTRMQKVTDFQENWRGNRVCSPKAVADEAMHQASMVTGDTFQFPLTPDAQDRDPKPRMLKDLAERQSCYEAQADSRVASLEDEDLRDIASGKKAPGYFDSTPGFEALNRVFDRACADTDERSATQRLADNKGQAYGLDELEAMLGATVPDKNDEFYEFLHHKLTECNRDNWTKGGIQETMESLEKLCGYYSRVTIPLSLPIVSMGPAPTAALAVGNLACSVPPAALAKLNHNKREELIAFRRSLGNQVSCDDAAEIMDAERSLDRAINGDVFSAALTAGFSVLELSAVAREVKTAQEAERLVEERVKLANALGKQALGDLPQLKQLSKAQLDELMERIETLRPMRPEFAAGAEGEDAFVSATKAFDKRVQDALAEVKLVAPGKSADEIAALLEVKVAPPPKSIKVGEGAKAAAREDLVKLMGTGTASNPARAAQIDGLVSRQAEVTTLANALDRSSGVVTRRIRQILEDNQHKLTVMASNISGIPPEEFAVRLAEIERSSQRAQQAIDLFSHLDRDLATAMGKVKPINAPGIQAELAVEATRLEGLFQKWLVSGQLSLSGFRRIQNNTRMFGKLLDNYNDITYGDAADENTNGTHGLRKPGAPVRSPNESRKVASNSSVSQGDRYAAWAHAIPDPVHPTETWWAFDGTNWHRFSKISETEGKLHFTWSGSTAEHTDPDLAFADNEVPKDVRAIFGQN